MLLFELSDPIVIAIITFVVLIIVVFVMFKSAGEK